MSQADPQEVEGVQHQQQTLLFSVALPGDGAPVGFGGWGSGTLDHSALPWKEKSALRLLLLKAVA